VLINSSLIQIGSGRKDVDELRVPVTDIANEIGSIKAANIVALGAFVARSMMVDFEILTESVKAEFAGKAKLIPLNMKALERGRQAAGK
jgi:2-oxoglutarate ferredoxin oxidoreductase subunit gamma